MAFWQSPRLRRLQREMEDASREIAVREAAQVLAAKAAAEKARTPAPWVPDFSPDPFPRDGMALPLLPDKPRALIARQPQTDKYPLILGSNLSGGYLTSAYRLGISGWRYQFVDLINELLEHDGHARGVTRQRVLAVAGGRVEILPAKLRRNHPDGDIAKMVSDEFAEQFDAIPKRTQAISQLNWGVIYGVSALETEWGKEDGLWTIDGLSNIHTRRLNYPHPTTWDLYIYDQGLVGPGFGQAPTNGVFGLRVLDYPGKFIEHTPALNADYPTRDGEARYIGVLMLLKRAVTRASAQDFERVIRPWILGYFNTNAAEMANGQQAKSVASDADITSLQNALTALGAGSMNNQALPDSTRIELLRAASAMSATEFLSFLNREQSKALLGQAFTTEPGANGNLSTSEMAKEGTMEILRYDARCISDSFEHGLVSPWMRLNRAAIRRALYPRMLIHVDETPDPTKIMTMAVQGTEVDMPIDVDTLAEQTGLTLVPAEDPTIPRRTRSVKAGKAAMPGGAENSQADDATADEVSGNSEPGAPPAKPAKPSTPPAAKPPKNGKPPDAN